ncbi:hypothetical protein [Raoultibacter phocaeensis]|uniref:hypothetical protein n=1 Tax=Raoultibacter phocaeensis TaxID=2479841 RepID=UPI00111B0AFD|nr:hypothetical protein [Raoultibacter phocaeensis]
MLGKLLKYDMAALSRVLVPVHIAALAVGLVAAACFFGCNWIDSAYNGWSGSSGFSASILVMLAMTGAFCLFALFMASAATFFAIVHRFYKNFFTDEGYLTLTLPVSANLHIASKVIAAALWLLIDVVIVGFCAYFASMAAMGFAGDFDETIPYFMLMSSYGFSSIESFASFMLAGSTSAMQVLAMVLTAYAAFALGSALAAKHKVAAGIGLFFALSWAAGLVHSIKSVLLATSFMYESSYNYAAANMLSSGVSLVLYLITSIVFYAVCVYVIDRKTNLA